MRSTNGRFFLDTNILVYAADASAPEKQAISRRLVAEAFAGDLAWISTQVLQEFFVIVTRKAGVPPASARQQLVKLMELPTIPVDRDLILAAVDTHLVHGVSFWDALVIRCAAAAGCGRVYTEDMSHGQVIEGVEIWNPYLRT